MQSDKQAVALSTGMNRQHPARPATPRRSRRISYLLAAAATIAVILAQTSTADAAPAGNTPDSETRAQLKSTATAIPPKVEKVTLNIPAESISSALTDLGAQTGLTIIVETKVSKGVKSDALHGTYTADEALKKLLEPAGLRADYLDSKTVAIRPAKEGENLTQLTPGSDESSLLRVAENSAGASAEGANSSQAAQQPQTFEDAKNNPSATPDKESRDSLQEVIVTGTSIRGVKVSTSPIIQLDRVAIDRSGYLNTADLLQSLPQAFAGGSHGASADGNWAPAPMRATTTSTPSP